MKRKTVTKIISNEAYTVLTSDELNIGNAYILDINIVRHPDLGYHFVIGHGTDGFNNLFVYFDGSINTSVNIMVHYVPII